MDLGCGGAKPPGFVGLDRSLIPGVDVIADLDHPLPFKSDSIDLVYASHSLEHTSSVIDVISEIYRVSCDRGQICIVSPYSNQTLNLANPFHRQAFNEHTPRFWTSSTDTVINSAEFTHPHAPEWGLADTDNVDINVDLRCLRMEFFYYPNYRYIEKDEQYAARKKFLDVCDQIIYHLVVVKGPMSIGEMNQLASETDFYDPPYVAVRRLTEQLEACNLALAQATTRIRELEGQAVELDRARVRINELEAHASELIRTKVRIRELDEQADELLQATERINELEAQASELRKFRKAAYSMELELNGFRRRRALRLLDRFRMRGDLSEEISPAFTRLRDDSYLLIPNLRGFLLQVSDNLRDEAFVSYPLEPLRSGLQGILLAPVIELPLSEGELGIEIVSPENEIILQSTKRAIEIDPTEPFRFDFAPIPSTVSGRFLLRIFVRGVDGPIRLFEWRKYRLFGLAPPERQAFIGLIFDES